mgnify:CR=1 FL=1
MANVSITPFITYPLYVVQDCSSQIKALIISPVMVDWLLNEWQYALL